LDENFDAAKVAKERSDELDGEDRNEQQVAADVASKINEGPTSELDSSLEM